MFLANNCLGNIDGETYFTHNYKTEFINANPIIFLHLFRIIALRDKCYFNKFVVLLSEKQGFNEILKTIVDICSALIKRCSLISDSEQVEFVLFCISYANYRFTNNLPDIQISTFKLF